jgi:hypothetical protein
MCRMVCQRHLEKQPCSKRRQDKRWAAFHFHAFDRLFLLELPLLVVMLSILCHIRNRFLHNNLDKQQRMLKKSICDHTVAHLDQNHRPNPLDRSQLAKVEEETMRRKPNQQNVRDDASRDQDIKDYSPCPNVCGTGVLGTASAIQQLHGVCSDLNQVVEQGKDGCDGERCSEECDVAELDDCGHQRQKQAKANPSRYSRRTHPRTPPCGSAPPPATLPSPRIQLAVQPAPSSTF